MMYAALRCIERRNQTYNCVLQVDGSDIFFINHCFKLSSVSIIGFVCTGSPFLKSCVSVAAKPVIADADEEILDSWITYWSNVSSPFTASPGLSRECVLRIPSVS